MERRLTLEPPAADPRHRKVAEGRVIDMVRMHAFAADAPGADLTMARAACAAAIERWVGLGLGHAVDGAGGRLFDPAEVTCFMRWADIAGYDRFWRDHWVPTSRAMVEDLASPGANRFSVTLRRTFDLRRFDVGASVRLRAPLPLVGDYHTKIELTPVIDPALGAVLAESMGRLEARLAVPADRRVSFGADIAFVAHDPAMAPDVGPLAPEDARLYLRHSEDLIRVTPTIRALAARLAGGLAPRAAAFAFWDYLIDTVPIGAIRYDGLDRQTAVESLLAGVWSDCQLAAALFISLCRARGLPARLIGGHFLHPLAPTKHYWAEVWLEGEGWRPFDAMSWSLSEGGRDSDWRGRFAGRLEPRMVTECFPRWFVGPMSVRFPPAWQMLQTPLDPGVESLFTDIEDGSLIYRDELSVVRLA